MQEPILTSPRIHKRSSSLPQAAPVTASLQQSGPVPPLKVGGRHSRQKSQQHSTSADASTQGLGFYTDPWLVRPLTPPEIPERHMGRLAIADCIISMNYGQQQQQQQHRRHSSEGADVEGVPSLISFSSDSDSGYLDHTLHSLYNCIRELYLSERQFCLELSVAVHEIMQKTLDMGLAERHMAILFHNLPEVYGISTGLVRLLEHFVPARILYNTPMDAGYEPYSVGVGQAMCEWLNGDMYRVYELYVHGYTAQVKVFQRLAAKHKGLHMCIGENSPHELPLRSLLQKPVQRISQYPIYLKAMLDLTPANHFDMQYILSAYERSRNYCYSINARICDKK